MTSGERSRSSQALMTCLCLLLSLRPLSSSQQSSSSVHQAPLPLSAGIFTCVLGCVSFRTQLKITFSSLVLICAKSFQSCPALCDPMDCSSPGSAVHGSLQARILEWVAMLSSRGSSRPRDQTHVSYISCTDRWVLYH